MPRFPSSTSSTAARRHADPPPFICTWEAGGSRAAWVYVAGDLDLVTAPQLRQTLAEAQLDTRLVVLDLREVTLIDSSGVHVILDAAAEARREWGRLMLVRGSVPVERMLTLTKVADRVLMVDLEPGEPSRGLLDVADTSRRRGADRCTADGAGVRSGAERRGQAVYGRH
jgi:anti-sigma B factor antagonist